MLRPIHTRPKLVQMISESLEEGTTVVIYGDYSSKTDSYLKEIRFEPSMRITTLAMKFLALPEKVKLARYGYNHEANTVFIEWEGKL